MGANVIKTPTAAGMTETETYKSTTRDVIGLVREVAARVNSEGLRSGRILLDDKDVRIEVEVKR